ncbi:P2Y purinoceptor 13-like [Gadus morhua]|uniref:P2Y purinoceptor 13-like n=1 Tax=Gadus morhua TaxID=8049 RepID=UPI0011B58FA2|nr:P2Y purinoceptor 13-like [Gadus morhua]
MTSNVTSATMTDCPSGPGMLLPFLYCIIFPFGVALNSIAVWISLHVRSTSTFMVYLGNLVLSDMVVTLLIPFEVFQDLNTVSAVFHMFSCRFLKPMKYTCMYVSISVLGLISVDRFFKIVQPRGQMLCQNLLFGRWVSAIVWVFMITTTGLPNMVLTDRYPNTSSAAGSCMFYKGEPGIRVHEVITISLNLFFWLVCVLVVVCYMCIAQTVIQSFRKSGSSNSQAKQTTKLRVFLVLLVFLVCFGPYHVVRVPYTFQQTKSNGSCSDPLSRYAKELGLLFATVNVCLDPIVYFFLCREYNEKLTAMITDAGNAWRRPRAWGKS